MNIGLLKNSKDTYISIRQRNRATYQVPCFKKANHAFAEYMDSHIVVYSFRSQCDKLLWLNPVPHTAPYRTILANIITEKANEVGTVKIDNRWHSYVKDFFKEYHIRGHY